MMIRHDDIIDIEKIDMMIRHDDIIDIDKILNTKCPGYELYSTPLTD